MGKAFQEEQMKNIYITKLILENVRNLDYTVIPLANDEKKHLIFTGKNGSGKTTILDGLSGYLDRLSTSNTIVARDNRLLFARKRLETLKTDKKF